jgi:dTDP-4-amino-4,6-dideoxygalactose transaminase
VIRIPFLKPNLVKKESYIRYIEQMEQSGIYSNFGPLNRALEQKVLETMFHSCGDVTTVNNATIGLMLAISQTKRTQGKYALMPSFTFAATPHAAIWCGLEPYFIDISPDDWCMNEQSLNEAIRDLGDKLAVVVPYATFGMNMDLTSYEKLIEKGIPVVVDAASSFGATFQGRHFGSGFHGTVVYSFHATKAFGIGEGGLIYSADNRLISRIRQAENFGFNHQRVSELNGLNGKMNELTAAVGLATLEAFPQKIQRRSEIYEKYIYHMSRNGLFEKGWTLQQIRGTIAHQFFPVLCPEDRWNHEIIDSLSAQQIEARTYFAPPCHQHPICSSFPAASMHWTEQICRRIVSLPLWETMHDQAVEDVVKAVCR